MRFIALLAIVMITPVFSAEVHPWNDGLKLIRDGKHDAYAVYIGRSQSRILSAVRNGKANTSGIPVIHLSSKMEVINPYSNKSVSGTRLISNLTGTVHELTGGTFLFMDKDGVIVPEMTIIHNFHKDRPEVLDLYCRMMKSPLRKKLSLAEFARLEGMQIGVTLTMEAEAGKHKDFSHIFREVPKDETYFRGIYEDKTVFNPSKDAVFTVVTSDPHGEVFTAIVNELWIKLTVDDGQKKHHPPLVILGPADADYKQLDILGIKYRKAYMTKQQLSPLPSPMVILPGNPERGPIEIRGFVPGQVIAQYVLSKTNAHLVNNQHNLHPDIPFGDLDKKGQSK